MAVYFTIDNVVSSNYIYNNTWLCTLLLIMLCPVTIIYNNTWLCTLQLIMLCPVTIYILNTWLCTL